MSCLQTCIIHLCLSQALAGKGEAKLSAVILKNFYDNKQVHAQDAELLANYLIRELQCLNMTDEQAILEGHVKFSTDLQGLTLPDEVPPTPISQEPLGQPKLAAASDV